MAATTGDGRKHEMKRISRACISCRRRKSRCDLDSYGAAGTPPCQRCVRDGSECILGSSNRGGRRVRKTATTQISTSASPAQSSLSEPSQTPIGRTGHEYTASYTELTPSSTGYHQPQDGVHDVQSHRDNDLVIESTFIATTLHNTSDALNFLSQAAENASHLPETHAQENAIHNHYVSPSNRVIQSQTQSTPADPYSSHGVLPYHLVTSGLLTSAQVAELVIRFTLHYHPYLPIAPRKSLDVTYLHETALNEPHLLTAMITIGAKDLPGGNEILNICSAYMHQLVSEISAGKRCDVEAVEGLLLLSEWEPSCSFSNLKEIGCGEEDLAAWMHVGLALRIGYFLGLDRTSLKNDDEERKLHFNRRRVAWAACYIADRQVSARLGKAFWSRGPGPTAARGGHDFPSLQPQTPEEEDFASIFQANLELTQLFGNVHDVLYSGMGSSMKMMLVGNYVKYVDDFRASINSWKSIWGTLTCSRDMKITLQMSYEYLRLYTNAYAFQATSIRAISSKTAPGGQRHVEFPHVGSLPDARFIYESVDAAKSLLTIVNSYVSADIGLRNFPLRFSLYCVNSAVFLYKAWSLGIFSAQEKLGVRRMISESISRLRKGSLRPTDFGSRYAQLLEILWQRTDMVGHPGGSTPATSETREIPSRQNPNPADEFSWLDVQAVGEFLTGDQDPGADLGLGTDNVLQYVQASRQASVSWNDIGWPEDNELNRFF